MAQVKKFNGGLFNPDLGSLASYCSSVPPGGVGGLCSADYRGWGGAFWFQNTRHSYWPRLAAGDFDAMEPHWVPLEKRGAGMALVLFGCKTTTKCNEKRVRIKRVLSQIGPWGVFCF